MNFEEIENIYAAGSLHSSLIPEGWEEMFHHTLPSMNIALEILQKEYQEGKIIVPRSSYLLEAYRMCPMKDVSVIIIGQDVYPSSYRHGKDRLFVSNGVAFTIPDQVIRLSQGESLRQIYQKVRNSGFNVRNADGDLTKWCKQGVLLTNYALTIEYIEENGSFKGSGTHLNVWKGWTTSFCEFVARKCERIVWVLFGRFAHEMATVIASKGKNHSHQFIKLPHPAARDERFQATEENLFQKINDALVKVSRQPIDWSL